MGTMKSSDPLKVFYRGLGRKELKDLGMHNYIQLLD